MKCRFDILYDQEPLNQLLFFRWQHKRLSGDLNFSLAKGVGYLRPGRIDMPVQFSPTFDPCFSL